MAKKHSKGRHRNARPRPRHSHRNAQPMPRGHGDDEEYKPGERLMHAAIGAAATTVAGAFLSNQGWEPEKISGALALAGAGLAWKGEGEMVRNISTSVMSAAGAQFGLLMLDKKKPPVQVAKRNAGDPDSGHLLAALERARMRAMLESEGYADAA